MRYGLLLTALLISLLASPTFAAGGKNQTKNPIFGDNCVETLPPGVDAEACEEVPAPAQAGVTVFFCETTKIIICSDEEEPETEEETQ